MINVFTAIEYFFYLWLESLKSNNNKQRNKQTNKQTKKQIKRGRMSNRGEYNSVKAEHTIKVSVYPKWPSFVDAALRRDV